MTSQDAKMAKMASPYTAAMTREQFLFYEMRATARLLAEGLDDAEALQRIQQENLFQYPTGKSLRVVALGCIRRLRCLQDDELVRAIAEQPVEEARQICLYAMMKQFRLVWDFMITVVGEKFETRDLTLSRSDLALFFLRLQEHDPWVASWSDSTIAKLQQVLRKTLVDTGYLESLRSSRLNPVVISPILEQAIRSSGDEVALSAFCCFS